jgi:hypothetical protein
MTITFEEISTLGGGWSLKVLRSGVPIGHVRRNPANGRYQYFHGLNNQLTVSREDGDLESLKAWVSAAYRD